MKSVKTQRCGLESAIEAWRFSLGDSRVLDGAGGHNIDTTRFRGQVPATLLPRTVSQVQEAMRIAQRYQISLYPISTGRNWGYGTSVPPVSPSVLVDLSGMDAILEVDPELGVATVQPGVTQGALHAYLRARELPFMVPVTGAGPSCSILANALERGFGITPETDHFANVISLSAVLPDGTLYQSPLRRWNSAGAASAYKWGVGPYIDGLFSQSGMGIVVDVSVALAPMPERLGAFFFSIPEAGIDVAASAVRQLMRSGGSSIGGINFVSRSRLEAMLTGRMAIDGPGGRRDEEAAGEAARLMGGRDWVGVGSLYGSRETYPAAVRLTRRLLGGRVAGLRFVSQERLRWLRSLGGWFERVRQRRGAEAISRIVSILDLIAGVPSELNLSLAYAASGECSGSAYNPARDGCGLIWYAPIVPMHDGGVSAFTSFVQGVCGRYGLPAATSLTALSSRCFAATVALLFDRSRPEEAERADACYRALLTAGMGLGYHPYRVGAQFMKEIVDAELPFWKTAASLKAVLDPGMLLAPGRYCPTGWTSGGAD